MDFELVKGLSFVRVDSRADSPFYHSLERYRAAYKDHGPLLEGRESDSLMTGGMLLD